MFHLCPSVAENFPALAFAPPQIKLRDPCSKCGFAYVSSGFCGLVIAWCKQSKAIAHYGSDSVLCFLFPASPVLWLCPSSKSSQSALAGSEGAGRRQQKARLLKITAGQCRGDNRGRVMNTPATKILLRFDDDAGGTVNERRTEHQVIRRAHRAGVGVHPEIGLNRHVQAGKNRLASLNHAVAFRSRAAGRK